jgi:hypothetical protein
MGGPLGASDIHCSSPSLHVFSDAFHLESLRQIVRIAMFECNPRIHINEQLQHRCDDNNGTFPRPLKLMHMSVSSTTSARRYDSRT